MWAFFLALVSTCFSPSLGDLTAKVTFPELPSMVSRYCKLPEQLNVEFVVRDQHINLNLTKSKIQENGKVLLVKAGSNGKPEFVDNNSHRKNVGVLYRGNSNLAALEVFCRMEDRRAKLSLEGTIELSDNKMYRIMNVGEHGLYTLVLENMDSSVFTAGLSDEDESSIQHRFKRASTDPVIHQDIFIDIVALVHFSVFTDFYERSTETNPDLALADTVDRIQRHFAHLFNAVDVRFKTASEKLNINLAATIIETEVSGDWFENVKATETDPTKIYAPGLLNEMNVYRMTDAIPVHDHFTSFTSVDMYWTSGGAVQDIAGLATLSQICQYTRKTVSTVEFQDNIITDVRITAHEVGHALGSPHDGLGNNPCDSADNYIMSGSPSQYTTTNPYKFSQCSADYFGKYINTLIEDGRSEFLQCLYESLAANVPDVSEEVLGQLMNTDEQCRQANGQESYHCRGFDTDNVCLSMYCGIPGTSSCSKRYAAKGTTCGDRMWCDAGDCVFHPDAPRADPECLWGDQPGVISNTEKECPQLVTSATTCTEFRRRYCCETCKLFEPACNMTSSSCSSPQVFDDFLCECVDATTTAPPTTTTTVTTTSTVSSTTITTTTPTSTTTTPTTTITDSTRSVSFSTTPITTSPTTTTAQTSTADSTTQTTTSTTPTTTQTTTSTSTTESTTPTATSTTTTTTTTTTPSTTAASSCTTAPEIPNSEVTVADGVATYKCQEGTLPSGGTSSGDTSTCTDGVWTLTTLQCRDVSSCYKKSGRYAVYSGTETTTNKGHTCQAWSSQSPVAHSHGSKDVHFATVSGYTENPSVAAQSNYCRDPYGFGKPFCFTLTPGVRIDYCHEVIPDCNTIPTTATPTSTQTTTVTSTTESTTPTTTSTTTTTTTTTTPSTTAASSCTTAPEIPNSEVTVADGVATYKCQEGTLPFGGTSSGDTSTCTDGVWSPTTLQCRDVSTCYQKSGRFAVYSGTQTTTNGGHTCQAWSSQSPVAHSQGTKDVHFATVAGYTENPTVAAQSNYCRDPSGYGKPFCFTMTPGKRIDYCDEVIPKCDCPEPPIVANSNVSRVDNKATYSCKEGFAATSATSSVSTCLNGLWSPVNIKCHDVSQCYIISGGSRIYTGTHSTTLSGHTCQGWTETTPQAHSYEAKHFIRLAGPDTTLADHGNYCRDPSGYGRRSRGYLWCFTTDPSKRLEKCSDVPQCPI